MASKDKNKKIIDFSGFTLIELLVSIFIIAIISSLFMVNYHNTNKSREIDIVKQKLASDIRLAQNYSLASKIYDSFNVPAGGWGVHFSLNDPTHYIIFADKDLPNGNQIYDAGEAVENKTLPNGITLDSLSVVSSVDTVDIVFLPPDPVTYINGSPNANTDIVLKENINNSTIKVSVNFFGLIDAN